MSDEIIKISELTATDSLNDGCCLPIVSSNETKKLTYSFLKSKLQQDLDFDAEIPEFTIDVNGHLLATFEGQSPIDVGRVKGTGIVSIAKTSTSGLVDTYTISYTDGTTSTFTVTNGQTQDLSAYRTSAAQDVIDNTKATTTALAKTDRSLDMLWKLNEGQTYDFDVDSESVYAKTVPSGAKYDSVDMIGGKSVVMNQLLEHGNFDALSSWYCDSTRATLSISNNVLTATIVSTGTVTLRSNLSCVSGHKYVVFFSIKSKNTSAVAITVGNSSSTTSTSALVADSWNSAGVIKESGSSEQYLRIRIDASTGYSVGDTFEVKNVNAIDLTQMFGSGNEPSTVAEFKAMFPADYYDYNTGEVKSAVVDKVNVRGKNMLNPTLATTTQNGVTCTNNGDGTYTLNGTATANTMFRLVTIGSCNNTKMVGCPSTGSGTSYYVVFLKDGTWDTNFIDSGSGVTIASSGSSNSIWIAVTSGATLTNVVFKPMITTDTTATYDDFVKYTSTDTAIPSAIRSLDGYGQGFGSSYNYVDYAEKKYHKVGSWVDGTWTPLATEVVTDISSMLTDGFLENLDVEANGTITFENTLTDMLLPVPVTNEFIIKLSEVS